MAAAIVDAVVAADEMPNMPHVELGQVVNFCHRQDQEAVLAVTGGLISGFQISTSVASKTGLWRYMPYVGL